MWEEKDQEDKVLKEQRVRTHEVLSKDAGCGGVTEEGNLLSGRCARQEDGRESVPG